MWQLDSKTEKVTSLSPGRGNLTNKRAKQTSTDPEYNFIFLNILFVCVHYIHL